MFGYKQIFFSKIQWSKRYTVSHCLQN